MTERFDFFILVRWVLNVYFCRRNLSTSLYANSVIGVGMASTMYHISRGEARKYTRWGDYAMIAASTLVCTILPGPEQRGVDQISFASAYWLLTVCLGQCLSTAIKRECNFSRMLILSSAMAIPFQPLLVTALHTSLMEVFLSAFTIPQCAQFCSDSSWRTSSLCFIHS